MITHLSQLNQNVFVVTRGCSFVNGALLEKLPVDALLGLSDTYLDVHLDFWHETLLHLSLDPSEHEWSKDFMELLDDLTVFVFLFLVSKLLICFSSKIKPFVKIV